MHQHACTEIVHTGTSAGQLFQGTQVFDYSPDQLIIYQPGLAHAVASHQAGVHLCVGVSGCGAESLRPGFWTVSDQVRRLLDQLQQAKAERTSRQTVRLDLLSGLVAVELAEQQYAEPRAQDKPPATAAREIMDTQFDQIVGIEDVASSLFISPDYLRQLFREQFGVSPLRYLIHRRIDAACELLRGIVSMPVHEVASRCGFDNPYYFARMFKKVTGLTPSVYRQRSRLTGETAISSICEGTSPESCIYERWGERQTAEHRNNKQTGGTG